jgi:hypothetical protein
VNPQARRYLGSLGVAVILTALIVAVASIIPDSRIGVLLWPGIMAAAIFIPGGIESDWPDTFLVLAALMNAFIFSWLVFGATFLVERLRKRRAT